MSARRVYRLFRGANVGGRCGEEGTTTRTANELQEAFETWFSPYRDAQSMHYLLSRGDLSRCTCLHELINPMLIRLEVSFSTCRLLLLSSLTPRIDFLDRSCAVYRPNIPIENHWCQSGHLSCCLATYGTSEEEQMSRLVESSRSCHVHCVAAQPML